MSANTFALSFTRQETVNLRRDGRMVTFSIGESIVITVDLYMGRCALHNPPAIGTLQKKNCFNRFFYLVKCTRYVADNTDDGLVVRDKASGVELSAHKTKVSLTLPTRSVMIIMMSIQRGLYMRESIEGWHRDYNQMHIAAVVEAAEFTSDSIPF